MSLKTRLKKLEARRLAKTAGNIYFAFVDGEKMRIECGTKTIFDGTAEEGQKILNDLDRPGNFILKLPAHAAEWMK
ncbi:MAG: hypothetical protein H0Z28_11660 [Archaeoglobus sp.]|nr:hypothetical protein [Archaeoglobus sp.]